MQDTDLEKLKQLKDRLNTLNGFFDQKTEEGDPEVKDILNDIDKVEEEIKKLQKEVC
jgi:hypothetical protein